MVGKPEDSIINNDNSPKERVKEWTIGNAVGANRIPIIKALISAIFLFFCFMDFRFHIKITIAHEMII